MDAPGPGLKSPFKCSAYSQAPPFSVCLLLGSNTGDAKSDQADSLYSLLPASYRGQGGDLVAARQDVAACLEQELDLRRLSNIQKHLWLAGVPLPPRPLHHQLLLGREVLITERMDMHLLWTGRKIFLKPVPRLLLDPMVWSGYLSCEARCGCASSAIDDYHTSTLCKRRNLRQRALGFLYSYAALISHESDFRMAQDKHLLPLEVQWQSWKTLVEQLDVEHIHAHIDHRFIHGELRLSRINKIYYYYQTPLRGYLPSWDRYGAYFRYYFAWLASATAYIAIVLTAMQVGLATDSLAHNATFQAASYGFTVFSILGPLAFVFLMVLYFGFMFTHNWSKAARRSKERFNKLNRA